MSALLPLLLALAPAAQEPAPDLPQAEDVADVPALDLHARGDEKKRYVLIGLDETRKVPRKGYGLILVLPGGDGSIDMHAFVKRIHKHAVPEGYLTVQLVAATWTPEQAKDLVWPTKLNTAPEARFTTEEFITDVVAEVKKRVKIDRRRIFTLCWSSSGPAGYSMSLQPKTPIRGSFIAMSAFHEDRLPALSRAKGQAYYILHSPQDFIPIQQAQTARDELEKAKAEVEFQTYQGGHGWQGDVYGMLRRGFTWLDEQAK